MSLITRAQLAAVAPHALPHVVTAIVDHADAVLPKYGLATTARLPHLMAHILVESAYLTTLTENLNYTAARLCQVWPTRFKTLAAAEPYAHQPEKLANLVYGGRMGNTGADDGWLNRGQGLLDETGHTNIASLAKHMGVPFETARAALTSDAGMLDAACAVYVMLGAPPFADKGDIVGETRRINGGLTGLADRRTALAHCQKVWPRVDVPKPAPIAPAPKPAAALPPAAPLPKSPVPPAVPPQSKAPVPVKSSALKSALVSAASLLGMTALAHAETVNVAPVLSLGVQDILQPVLEATVPTVAALLAMPVRRYLGEATADSFAKRVDGVLDKAIAAGAKDAEAYLGRADFDINVDGWIQELAVKYAMGHAPALMKQAGASLAKTVADMIGEKVQARLGSHVDVLTLKSKAAAKGVAAPAEVRAAA